MTTLDAALALQPDHLSLYAPDARRPRRRRADRARRRPPADDPRRAPLARDRAARAGRGSRRGAVPPRRRSASREAGWRGYEISNWARPGHESRHNLAYWERRPYEAVGPGAHAFDGATRRWNAARLDGYLAALTPRTVGAGLPPGGAEAIDAETAAAETVILGLRTGRGVPLATAHRAAPRRRLRLGAGRRARRRHPGRPGRADDARPAAVQRAVRAARLSVPARPRRVRRTTRPTAVRCVDTPPFGTATMPTTSLALSAVEC